MFSCHICKSLLLCVSASFFHSNLWLYVSLFIWFITVMNLVCSKFSKHVIFHIWKVSNLHLWPEFKNFFNYAIWNFEMILKILFEKYFQNFPYSFQYSMCIIYFWKLHFSKDFPKRDIKLFLIGGENKFSILFKITYSKLVFWNV